MQLILWVYIEDQGLVCLGEEPEGDENYLAEVYPDCIYFFAGVAPIPEED